MRSRCVRRIGLALPVLPLHIAGRVAVSRSRTHWLRGDPPVPWETEGLQSWTVGPWLTTASVLRGAWEVRLARVDAADPGPWRLRIGGWAVAADQPPTARVEGATAAVRRADGLTSIVSGLRGLTEAGYVRSRDRNPFGRHAVTPWVATGEPVVLGRIYAAVVVLSGVELTGDVGLTVADDAVTVVWPDGEPDRLTLPSP